MRKHVRVFVCLYLKKPIVWVLAFIYFLLLIQISMNDLKTVPIDIAGLYYFWIAPYLDAGVMILTIILTSLSSVHFFIEEWNSGIILFNLTRKNLNQYVKSLIIRILLVAAVVPLVGILIYSVFVLTKFPLVGNTESYLFINSIETLVNGSLLVTNYYIIFYFLLLLNIIYSHIVFVIYSVWISLWINNKYIIFIVPTILYTLFNILSSYQIIPVIVNPLSVFGFYPYIDLYFQINFGTVSGHIITYIYPTIYFIILTVLAFYLIRFSLNRKIKKGITWGGGLNANV